MPQDIGLLVKNSSSFSDRANSLAYPAPISKINVSRLHSISN